MSPESGLKPASQVGKIRMYGAVNYFSGKNIKNLSQYHFPLPSREGVRGRGKPIRNFPELFLTPTLCSRPGRMSEWCAPVRRHEHDKVALLRSSCHYKRVFVSAAPHPHQGGGNLINFEIGSRKNGRKSNQHTIHQQIARHADRPILCPRRVAHELSEHTATRAPSIDGPEYSP